MRILVVKQYFHPDVASTSQILTELCEDLDMSRQGVTKHLVVLEKAGLARSVP
jgi:DNA-binding MarR family transcriptional regulator